MPQDLFIQIRGLGHTLPQVMMSLKSINTMSGGGGPAGLPPGILLWDSGIVDFLRIRLNLSFYTLDKNSIKRKVIKVFT